LLPLKLSFSITILVNTLNICGLFLVRLFQNSFRTVAYAIVCKVRELRLPGYLFRQDSLFRSTTLKFIEQVSLTKPVFRVTNTSFTAATFLTFDTTDNHLYLTTRFGNRLTNPFRVLTFANCLINQS